MVRDNVKKLLAYVQHNNRWLLEKYHTGLETHLYVTAGNEDQKVAGKNAWTNGVHTWKQIRWPYDSDTKPHFKDFTPDFPLDPDEGYLESVGCSWWCWENLESEGCVFDIDSIIGHKAGLTEKELKRLIKILSGLSYVNIIRSTSGKGYHILVFFQEGHRPKTKNHTEHATVAEAVLKKMSADSGLSLEESVDCFGKIGWIWSIRATEENKGFSMVKQASVDLTEDDISGWQNLPAKKMRRRPKIVAFDVDGNEIEDNNILGFSDERTPLDKEHRKILKALEDQSQYNFAYLDEHHLFHTHTSALRNVHRKLGLKGPFETETSESNTCNCYIRPVRSGGFNVFRFGTKTTEHPLWNQEGKTTWCTYNQSMTPHKMLIKIGADYTEKKEYEFETNPQLLKAVDSLGNKVPLKLKDGKRYALSVNGRGLIIKCYCDKDDSPADCDGWERVKGYYKKVLSRLPEVDKTSILAESDKILRFAVQEGKSIGWFYRKNKPEGAKEEDELWISCSETQAKRAVSGRVGAKDSEMFLQIGQLNPWVYDSVPFEREHLPGRVWNRRSAQLRYQCSNEAGPHPHWDKILKHIGQSWDDPLQDHELNKYGICNGADYLRAWIACMIRYPESPLPYIFLYGPQNTGKSIIHEALRECLVDGVVHAGNALTNSSGFNGELEGKVLAAVDEKDLSKFPEFGARMKAWVNATFITIHKKNIQPYDTKNYIKIIQTANSIEALVIDHDDTRVVVGWVPKFSGVEIPKEVFIKRCIQEFPYFLYTLGTLQLPPMTGRTRLPVISTDDKEDLLASQEPSSRRFIREMYHDIPGQYVVLNTAYEEYLKWCKTNNVKPIKPNDFKIQVGIKWPVHKGPRGRALTIGNISINKNAETKAAFTMEGKDGRHCRCN